MNKELINRIKSYFHPAFAGLGAFLFGTMTRESWKAFFIEGMAHYFLFSAFVGLGVAKLGFYTYDFLTTENKSAGKLGALLREALGTAVMSSAVLGGFIAATTFATLTPILFTIGMGINAVYNLAVALYCAYKWATVEDEDSRARFKGNFIKHAVGSVFGAAATVSVMLLMVFKVAPVVMAFVNAGINIAGFVLGVYGIVQELRAERQSRAAHATVEEPRQQLLAPEVEEINAPRLAAPQPQTKNYFYREQIQAPLTKQKLQVAIDDKIEHLKDEMRRDENSWFSQKTKRQNKVIALAALSKAIDDDSRDPIAEVKNKHKALFSGFRLFPTHPFQSFGRELGGVESLFKQAEQHARRPASR